MFQGNHGWRVERCDECARFASDEDAWSWVSLQAERLLAELSESKERTLPKDVKRELVLFLWQFLGLAPG